MLGLFYPYGLVLQALAILHFVRRRPDNYWLWIILMGGGVAALVYMLAEMAPDARLLGGAFQVFPRRKRIKALEVIVIDNPSSGNYEELGDLYLDDKQFARARESFDRVIATADSIDPRYRRALAALALNDMKAAAADLEIVVAQDRRYDYHRAAGLLAHAYATLGNVDKADSLFAEVTQMSTLSETQYNYASFLASQGRHAEAREWGERILRKKATMPDYIRRQERPWFRKTRALLKRLPK